MTKVEAIVKVMEENGGHASWPEIYRKIGRYQVHPDSRNRNVTGHDNSKDTVLATTGTKRIIKAAMNNHVGAE